MTMKSILHRSVNALPFRGRDLVRRLPIISVLQRWIVRKWLSEEPFIHKLNAGPSAGLRFEIHLPADKAVWLGNYEILLSRAIQKVIMPTYICFDIGGYHGYMAGLMAINGAKAVYVFEPMPDNREAIQRLIALNPELRIDMLPVAAGAEDGVAEFKVMSDRSMGKLASSTFQEETDFESILRVDVRSIDILVANGDLPPPDLIKIDVEGAEIDVLMGALGVLRRHHPVLFIEAHSDYLESQCTSLLSDLGYSVSRLDDGNVVSGSARHLVAI